MNKQEAIDLLTFMQQDISSTPNQFNISINHVGQSITSNGGTGLSITMNGGGAEGSTSIGNQVTLDTGTIEIRNKQINAGINQTFNNFLQTIDRIKAEIAGDMLDKTHAKDRVASFFSNLIPSVIVAMVIKIIALL